MLGYTFVTPAQAEEILEKNTYNRPLRSGVVEKYMRDMLNGEWMKNGSTIVVATDNTLLDGQHRLFAVCEAACKNSAFKGVHMIVVRDADKSVLPTIDTGAPRSFADYKKLVANGTGHTFPYAGMVQAALRLVYWYENVWPGSPSTGRSRGASHLELDELLSKYPNFPELVAEVGASDSVRRLGMGSSTAFVFAMAAQKYPQEARAWLEILRTGDAPLKHPGRVLREKLMLRLPGGARMHPNTRIVYLIKGWNAFARGEVTMGSLRWEPEELIPAIFGTPQYTGKRAAHTKLFHKAAAAVTPQEKGAIKTVGKRRRAAPKVSL